MDIRKFLVPVAVCKTNSEQTDNTQSSSSEGSDDESVCSNDCDSPPPKRSKDISSQPSIRPLSPKYDIAKYANVDNLNAQEKYDLIKNVYTPNEEFDFPSSTFCGKNRKFVHSWLQTYQYLAYSPTKDAAFCVACTLFAENKADRGLLISTGFRNWQKANSKMNAHWFNKPITKG